MGLAKNIQNDFIVRVQYMQAIQNDVRPVRYQPDLLPTLRARQYEFEAEQGRRGMGHQRQASVPDLMGGHPSYNTRFSMEVSMSRLHLF